MSYTPTYPELDNDHQRKQAAKEIVRMRQRRDQCRAEANELAKEDPLLHRPSTQTALHMASAYNFQIMGYRHALQQFFE